MAPQLSRATQHHYGGLTCENNYAYERAWATCGHFKQEKKSLASLLFDPSSSALFQKLRDSPTTRRDVHGETIALGLMLLLWRRHGGVAWSILGTNLQAVLSTFFASSVVVSLGKDDFLLRLRCCLRRERSGGQSSNRASEQPLLS